AVCDPLHRRYLLLPALPDHLADLVHQPDIVEREPFLAPPGDSSFRDFRVMCLVRCTTKLVLFVFSSCAGQWLADPITFDVFGCVAALRRYYAHGCFCWQTCDGADMLVLDTRGMEFSTVDLPPPPGSYMRDMAIVEAEEGRFGMFTISDKVKRGVYHLLYATRCKDGNGENQWQPKPPISLPENYRYCIKGVAGGYLLLIGYPKDDRPTVDYFSLNLQTFQVEWFCQTGDYVMIGHMYADLPPPLSPPTL
uniref:F-box associated domain-containing protein n=2 Tax=Aegilops tauschii subsp. strangulata TaxID=200361 RepID=A0A453QIN1_AEGTS